MKKFPTEKPLTWNPSELSRKILEKVLLEMELPNCFGLYGNWWSWKSSVLKWIQEIIDSEYTKIMYIHFDAWKYEYSKDNDLLFALLSEIKKKFNLSKENWKKLSVITWTVFSSLIKSISIDIWWIGIKWDSFSLQEISKEWEFLESKLLSDHERWIDTIESFKKDFEKIIKEWLAKNKTEKLIIFIDDLDRCLPENTVKLIETIKNFLSVENTLFVFAVDQRVVSEMIEKKYGLHHGYWDEYLLKIISYNFELPPTDLWTEIERIFTSHDIKGNLNVPLLQEFIKQFCKEPRIAKHFVQQLCIYINLNNKIQEWILEDESQARIYYLFVALFMIRKFPKIFGQSIKECHNTLGGLKGELYSTLHARWERFEQNKQNNISEDERKKLHEILKSKNDEGAEYMNIVEVGVAMEKIKWTLY